MQLKQLIICDRCFISKRQLIYRQKINNSVFKMFLFNINTVHTKNCLNVFNYITFINCNVCINAKTQSKENMS